MQTGCRILLKPNSSSSPCFSMKTTFTLRIQLSFLLRHVQSPSENIMSAEGAEVNTEYLIKKRIHSSWCGWTASGHMFCFWRLSRECQQFILWCFSPHPILILVSVSVLFRWYSELLGLKWISRTVKAHYGAGRRVFAGWWRRALMQAHTQRHWSISLYLPPSGLLKPVWVFKLQ